jgi:hypothetical protein
MTWFYIFTCLFYRLRRKGNPRCLHSSQKLFALDFEKLFKIVEDMARNEIFLYIYDSKYVVQFLASSERNHITRPCQS